MRKTKKFASGGTGRADAMRDRRMADIEKDYKRALARGMSERQAQAKRDQRIADARDDYAKRTGADRTETRAAERAAEQKLTATRRGADTGTKPVSVVSEGSKSLAAKADMPEVKTPKVGGGSGGYDSMSFSAAFRQAMKDKGKGETFTWKGTSYKLETAGEKKAPAPARPAQSAGRSATTRGSRPAGRGPVGEMVDNMRLMARQVRAPAPAKKAATPAPAPDKKPTEARALLSQRSNLPAPVPIRAPLTGLQAIAKRRQKAEQERRPPASKTAEGTAALRQLSGAKFAKGGKIDGIAIRGKTRAMRKK